MEQIKKNNKIDTKTIYYHDQKYNYNILHLAIELRYYDYNLIEKIISQLNLSRGIEELINEETEKGETPLDIALRKKNEEIINLLKKNGAKEKNVYIDKSEEIDKDLFKNLGMNFNINVNEIEVELLEKAIPVGLKNIHGSCYFNTVLQCLFHIKKLSLYFLKKKKNLKIILFQRHIYQLFMALLIIVFILNLIILKMH